MLQIAIVLLVWAVLYYFIALTIRQLADRNKFFTLVKEGTAKAIMVNGRFAFCIMSFAGHIFKADSNTPPESIIDEWDVVDRPLTMRGRFYLPLLRNIRWIGLPPFSDTHKYRFSWTSIEEGVGTSKDLNKEFHHSDKVIDYILVQDDVYGTKIKEAESSENIPLDVDLLIGGHVVNPYKALFNVERWLEATTNRIDSKMRDFVGGKTYEAMRQVAETTGEGTASSHALMDYFKESVVYVEEHWGFKIDFLRILSVAPGSELARAFIDASTKKYVATQQAEADIEAGRGLAARDKAHFEAVSKIEGGVEMLKWTSIKESKLTTFAEGGGVKPAIPLGGSDSGRTSNPTPTPGT